MSNDFEWLGLFDEMVLLAIDNNPNSSVPVIHEILEDVGAGGAKIQKTYGVIRNLEKKGYLKPTGYQASVSEEGKGNLGRTYEITGVAEVYIMAIGTIRRRLKRTAIF